MLAQFFVSPEEPVSGGLLEAERGGDAPVDLGAGVLPVQVNLFGAHPVHVELGKTGRVMNLEKRNMR